MIIKTLQKSFRLIAALAVLNVFITTGAAGAPSRESINSSASLTPEKLVFQEVVSGLNSPVYITNAGDGSNRLFIVEQGGKIRILKNGALLSLPFINLNVTSSLKTGGEAGLLSVAFHPSYETNGLFYVLYTAPRPGDAVGSKLTLERFTVSSGNPDRADFNSGVVLLSIGHPGYSNHNGGTIAFGADGYLYWSTGDGGGGGDPNENGQDKTTLLGKILRIDVDSGSPYTIPPDNPFYANVDSTKKEIWAYGLRNPWRFSFDSLTHDLYIGDVGQDNREEIDFQSASSAGGENYGWNVMEGSLCYSPDSGCNQSGKVLPVAEYNHGLGCSVTGGYVYRGANFPSMYGHYFYGDFCTGRFFELTNDSGWQSELLLQTPYNISTFGEDEQKELYLADLGSGIIYNIQYMEGPVVSSIVRADPDPTNASSVDFTVTFSEAVTGVNTAPPFDDFSLVPSGVEDAVITAVNGSGSIYTVTVNTGLGNGSIRLDVIDDDSIIDGGSRPLGGIGPGNGDFTDGESYSIDKGPHPSIPNLVSPADSVVVAAINPLFDWSNSTLPAGTVFGHYQFQIATDVDFTNIVHDNELSPKNNSQDDSAPLARATTFYWRVRSVSAAGSFSPWSAVRVVKTRFPMPTLDLPISGSTTASRKPTFSWDPVIGASNYTIQISRSNTFQTQVVNTQTSGSTSFMPINNLASNVTFYWRVRAAGAPYGPGAWSAVFNFKTP